MSSRRPLRTALLAASIALAATGALAAASLADTAPSATPLRVSVMGNLGTTDMTTANRDIALAQDARGMIGLGDYIYEEWTAPEWFDIMEPLLERGAWFAKGNHDDMATFGGYMPGNTPQWSILLNGVRVVALDTQEDMAPGSPQLSWLATELSHEPNDALKIVIMHMPWWLPREYTDADPATMDAMMDALGVDLVLAAHRHAYERVQRPGVEYVVVGTGGVGRAHPLEPTTGTYVTGCRCYGNLILDISPDAIIGQFVDTSNTTFDWFGISATGGPPAPPPLRISAYGNIGSSAYAVMNRDLALAEDAQGLLGLGDYVGERATADEWTTMMDPLLSRGAWFARGSNDRSSMLGPYLPGGETSWSVLLNGVRVIGINTQADIGNGSEQRDWLVTELEREGPEAIKVVVMHRAWWIEYGSFRGDGGDMDALMADHGVDLVLAAHLDSYMRSADGEVDYAVVGTGGEDLAGIAPLRNGALVAACSCHGQLVLDMNAEGIDARFVMVDGSVQDAWRVD